MILRNLPGIFAAKIDVVVKLVPEGQCREKWTGEVGNRRHVQAPYCSVYCVYYETKAENESDEPSKVRIQKTECERRHHNKRSFMSIFETRRWVSRNSYRGWKGRNQLRIMRGVTKLRCVPVQFRSFPFGSFSLNKNVVLVRG